MSAAIFAPANLDRILAETLPASTSAEHRHAVVATVDTAGAQVVVSFARDAGRLDWTVQAVARHDWTGETAAAGRVILKW